MELVAAIGLVKDDNTLIVVSLDIELIGIGGKSKLDDLSS